MPRKKKEETSATPKPVRKTKTVKSVKKTSEKALKPKKETVKKILGQSENAAQVHVVAKKSSPVSKAATSLDVADAVPTTREFKSLPRHGETQIVAFIRDPQCVFTYWEVTPERLEEVKRDLREEFKDSYMVLRLFTVGPNGERILSDEIRIDPGSN
jgi:hypothetical protein